MTRPYLNGSFSNAYFNGKKLWIINRLPDISILEEAVKKDPFISTTINTYPIGTEFKEGPTTWIVESSEERAIILVDKTDPTRKKKIEKEADLSTPILSEEMKEQLKDYGITDISLATNPDNLLTCGSFYVSGWWGINVEYTSDSIFATYKEWAPSLQHWGGWGTLADPAEIFRFEVYEDHVYTRINCTPNNDGNCWSCLAYLGKRYSVNMYKTDRRVPYFKIDFTKEKSGYITISLIIPAEYAISSTQETYAITSIAKTSLNNS